MSALVYSVGKQPASKSKPFAHTADDCRHQLPVFCKQMKSADTTDHRSPHCESTHATPHNPLHNNNHHRKDGTTGAVGAANNTNPEVDEVVADQDDVKINADDVVVVWIEPLDAAQGGRGSSRGAQT